MRLEEQHQVVKELLDVIDELNDTAPHRNQEEIANGKRLLDYLVMRMHLTDEDLKKSMYKTSSKAIGKILSKE